MTVEIRSETDFSWRLGVNGIIYQCGRLAVGGCAQYFQTSPTLNYAHRDNVANTYFGDNDILKFREFQASVGLSYIVDIMPCLSIVPYGSFKWSRVRTDADNISFLGSIFYDLRNRKEWGYSLGLTLVGSEKVSLSFEGCFADELAFHINNQIRF